MPGILLNAKDREMTKGLDLSLEAPQTCRGGRHVNHSCAASEVSSFVLVSKSPFCRNRGRGEQAS